MQRLIPGARGDALAGLAVPGSGYAFSTRYRLYLRSGEEFALWMNPISYLRQVGPDGSEPSMPEEARRRLLLCLFQERLRKLLYIFLHGHTLPELARVLVVLGDRSGDRISGELRALDFLAGELRDYAAVALHQTRATLRRLLQEPRIAPGELAAGLAVFHRELSLLLEEEGKGGVVHRVEGLLPFQEESYLSRDEAYFRPLVEMARHFRERGTGLLRIACLHGSLAALDHVRGFSDVETLLLVRRDVVMDGESLMRLREVVVDAMPYLYRIDPFQHHGHFVMSEVDLDFYPQSLFPLVLFPTCRAFLGADESLVFRERDSGLERRRAVWDLCYLSRRRYLEKNLPRNFYEWKAHLKAVLRIPRAYLDARGVFGPRRESFARAAADFPPGAWEIVEHAAAVRRGWKGGPRRGRWAMRMLGSPLVADVWPWLAGHAGGRPRHTGGTGGLEGLRLSFLLSESVIEKLRQEGIL